MSLSYEEYIKKLPEALEINQALNGDETLEELNDWDSLKLLSFIAFADTEFGRHPQMSDLKTCRTLMDLYKLLT